MKRISCFLLIVATELTLIPSFPAFARQTNEVKCEGGATGASAETKSYFVSICGYGNKENPFTFVLTEKKGKTIILRANKKDPLSAKSGSVEYFLITKAPKEPNPCECGGENVRLIIKKAGKVIISERVIHDRGGYFFLP